MKTIKIEIPKTAAEKAHARTERSLNIARRNYRSRDARATRDEIRNENLLAMIRAQKD